MSDFTRKTQYIVQEQVCRYIEGNLERVWKDFKICDTIEDVNIEFSTESMNYPTILFRVVERITEELTLEVSH